MIFVDFESILLPELIGKKIQLSLKRINLKYIASSYGFKLVYADDK